MASSDITLITYEDFDAIVEEYNDIKKTFEKMQCHCFGLYTLDPYEHDITAAQGTSFVLSYTGNTEEALIDVVKSEPDTETYLIVPIIKKANGEQIPGKQIYKYKGTCKVLLPPRCDYGKNNNRNKRVWIDLEGFKTGREDECGTGYATIEEPDTWKPYNCNKYALKIRWKGYNTGDD